MNKISLALLLGLMASCATVTPDYDAKFGDAVRAARISQTINPDAAKNPDPAAGVDGKAAHETILLYQGAFKKPPPAVNVINIGGAIGGGGGQ